LWQFYELLCRSYERNVGPLGPVSNIFVGYVSEWMHLPFTMPIEVTSTVYQSNIGIIRPEIADEALVKLREENYRAVKQLLKGGSEETAKDTTHESVVKALEELDRGNSKVLEQVLESAKLTWFDTAQDISKGGWTKLYEGLGSYWFLNFKPAIQDATFDQIKAAYLASVTTKSLTDLQAFLLGVLARVIATVVVFPAQKAKVLAISTAKEASVTTDGDAAAEVPDGTLAQLAFILKTDGPAALYRGLGPELYRGMLSAGLMYFMKERIKKLVVAFMFFLAGKKR